MHPSQKSNESTNTTKQSNSSKEYTKYADHKFAGWLKQNKKTSLPKSFKPMMHWTPTGIVIICILNEKIVFYNFNANNNKVQELASFSLAEYFHVGGEFIHYQSFLVNSRYIYLIKNSFPNDEEHIFFFELQSKKLLSIKNDDTRPSTFRMNYSVNVSDLKLYFFGGLNFELECLNSLEAYNFETYKWEQVPTKGKSPDPRHSHNTFIVGPNLYVMGGTKSQDYFSREGMFDDFFMLNMTTMTWTPIRMYGNPPKSLCYNYTFQISKKYVIFLSWSKEQDYYETQVSRFDLNHYEWENIELVSGSSEYRFGAGHCFDEENMTCLIFGGNYLSKVEAQCLSNDVDRIKISDQKDWFKGNEILGYDTAAKNKEEPKSAERESAAIEGDSESEEISFEELLEREKRLIEEEKTKQQTQKAKKKAVKKKRDSKSKADNLD